MRRHKGITKCPKQKTTQARKTTHNASQHLALGHITPQRHEREGPHPSMRSWALLVVGRERETLRSRARPV